MTDGHLDAKVDPRPYDVPTYFGVSISYICVVFVGFCMLLYLKKEKKSDFQVNLMYWVCGTFLCT